MRAQPGLQPPGAQTQETAHTLDWSGTRGAKGGLPKAALLQGTACLFFSMTEPDVSGADPTGLRTTAVLDGDEWVINGHKWFSSSAEGAAFGIVMAVTDPDAPPHQRMSQILVPADTPGYELIRPIPVMGHPGPRAGRPTARCATPTSASPATTSSASPATASGSPRSGSGRGGSITSCAGSGRCSGRSS